MNNDHHPQKKPKLEIRLLIINSSGNSTKTSTGRGFIKNRMHEPRYYTVGTEAKKITERDRFITAKRIPDLHSALMKYKSVIVEIEISAYEKTIDKMKEIRGCHQDYDIVLVPVINSSSKLIEDSIRTIEDLINIGIPSDKLRVLFNREPDSNERFDKITDKLKKLKIHYDLRAQIKDHDFYQKLEKLEIEYDDVTESTLDADEDRVEQLRVGKKTDSTDPSTQEYLQKKLIELVSVQRAVLSSKSQHDEVFNMLFGDPA